MTGVGTISAVFGGLGVLGALPRALFLVALSAHPISIAGFWVDLLFCQCPLISVTAAISSPSFLQLSFFLLSLARAVSVLAHSPVFLSQLSILHL